MCFEKLPAGTIPINAMYIYTVKDLADGKEKKKARLVAKGCSQNPGIHFGETFALTLNPVTFRVMLSMAIQHDLFLSQIDVKTAPLIPILPPEEAVYIRPFKGLTELCKSIPST